MATDSASLPSVAGNPMLDTNSDWPIIVEAVERADGDTNWSGSRIS